MLLNRSISALRSAVGMAAAADDAASISGSGGPHFCLGASLARLELRVLFEELARRVPVLRSLGAPAYLRPNIVAGIKHLPVDLSATPVRSTLPAARREEMQR